MSEEQHYSQERKALLGQEQEKNGVGNSGAKEKHSPALPCFYSASWRLVSQGAEARVWFVPNYTTVTYFNSTSVTHDYGGKAASLTTATSSAVCKERFHKSYRHQYLNVQLTKTRVKSEVKCITKCRKHGLNVPLILGVDLSGMCIFMEFLAGKTVREVCLFF
jgi:tRNA A-37 threonylcarbamoyl transferase component Bud32